MDITIKLTEIEQLQKTFPDELAPALLEKIESNKRWSNELTLSASLFTKEQAEYLIANLEDQKQVKPLRQYLAILTDTNKPVGNLKSLAIAFELIFKELPHKWLFKKDGCGEYLAYYIESVKYTPPEQRGDDYTPASTKIKIVSAATGESKSASAIYFGSEDLSKEGTPLVYLDKKGYICEDELLYLQYVTDITRYQELFCGKTGHVWQCIGLVRSSSRYSWGAWEYLQKEGEPTYQVIVDDGQENEDGTFQPYRSIDTVASAAFWEGGEAVGKVPIHPFVRVFIPKKHSSYLIHSNHLQDYQWQLDMADKLVLPEEEKELVRYLLSEGTSTKDIVAGKSGGTIIIATGPPGTGKTLTAQVYSESVQRPLYEIQCSQLGTSPDSLEQALLKVFVRSARWGAILLIDEADVYIHTRGDDIKQNAIVGVFLRLLEYYQGILFMTSNRIDCIDDAILSRASIWIEYSYPGPQQRENIWRVLAEQAGLKLQNSEGESIYKELANIGKFEVSGRSIKGLLGLANKVAQRKGLKYIDVPLIQWVSKFYPLETRTNSK